ncbi:MULTISPECIES: hypothetical protein [unclassified Pseudonocardia]|uniref:hypothetical protein n=1 Tax=unclassified Pseudonocardia TaxID=2619320 RepID=UPI0001FFDF81|nr:hypothetical protein [Pseudonocardia sp. Ae707_Ps1]OLM17590.1 hypothetical protein Ae707Ps1_1849 [Pseudonocardia sp. Ae707_Ps1]
MSRAGTVVRAWRYPYANPAKYRGGPPRFYVVRGEVVGDPARPDGRTFWWERPDPSQPYNLRANIHFEPSQDRRVHLDDCLYTPLPLMLDRHPEVVVWTEGETDADAALKAYRVPTTTHSRGAQAATAEQAAHFRKYRGTVLVVADRDPAGYAGALFRRRLLLREAGLAVRQVRVVRPADGVLAGGGGCAKGVVCECATPCPPPSQQAKGADLKDHVAAGRTLRELQRVPLAELQEAAAQVAEQTAQGWTYTRDAS